MAGSLNKVTLIGNIGGEPEFRATGDGKELATFSLATSDSWKDKATGERKERTEWHRVVVFSEGLVNVIKNYVHKGSKLFIEGALQTRKWTDNNGVEKYTTEVILQGYSSQLILLDAKGSKDSANTFNERSNNNPEHNNEIDDEIPF